MFANRLAPAIVLACVLVAVGLLEAEPPGAKVFRAGAHAIDITPRKFPISVNGGMQDRQAQAAHDRLHARCLVLDDGTSRLAIAVCDSCMIPRETVLLADYPATVRLKLQAVRVGGLGIVAIPCEVFAATGLEIKRQSPLKPTFIIELASGYNGYLPTPEQHQLGGYETWRARSSYLEVEAATKITAAVLQLLRKVQ